MEKNGHTVRYTAEEIAAMIARGEDRTNLARIDATTPEEIDRHAEDDSVLPEGWAATAIPGVPPRKEHISIRIDTDVLDWFKGTGAGYQTRINHVLRAFVESRRRAAPMP